MAERESGSICLPQKLPGTLWGITAFFNPIKFERKYENFIQFRQKSKSQGMPLLAVELAFDDAPFELRGDDADKIIQLRGGTQHMLWQKETLLNIALKHLPPECDKVAWIDCDVLFKNENWVADTSALLEEYMVVQPFGKVVRMAQGLTDIADNEIERLPIGWGDMQVKSSLGKEYSETCQGQNGHPGFAWSARRSLLSEVGFFDHCATASSDYLMSLGFAGLYHENPRVITHTNIASRASYYKWAFAAGHFAQGSLSYTPGTLLHLWHGNHGLRVYPLFDEFLRQQNLDPEKDIRYSESGLKEIREERGELIDGIREYFKIREGSPDRPFSRFLVEMVKQYEGNQNYFRRTRQVILTSDSYKLGNQIDAILKMAAPSEKVRAFIFNITTSFFNIVLAILAKVRRGLGLQEVR